MGPSQEVFGIQPQVKDPLSVEGEATPQVGIMEPYREDGLTLQRES